MKKQFFSTCIPGMEDTVAGMLRKEGGVSVDKILSGAVIYRYLKDPDFPFLQRDYLLLAQLKREKDTTAAARRFLSADAWMDRFPFEQLSGKHFRLVTAENGQPTSADMRVVAMIEKMICDQTNLLVSRERPDVELWIDNRQDGAFFLWRLSRSAKDRTTDPLRRDLAEIIACQANVRAKNVYVPRIVSNNLMDAMKRQGAKNITLTDPADGKSAEKIKGVRILRESAGRSGLPDASQEAAVLLILPKGNAIADQDIRSFLRETRRVLSTGSMLITLIPAGKRGYLRDVAGFDVLDEERITLSGEACTLFVARRLDEAINMDSEAD